jgi:hypothetical protein
VITNWLLLNQGTFNRLLSAHIEFLVSYRAPTPVSTFLVYHKLERWGA